MTLAPGAELELDVTEMTYGASALGRTSEGQVVFVDDALPGERVRATIARQRRNYMQARALDVLAAAPERIQPPCPYVPECGGCQWQHATYEAQVALKAHVLAETMRRAGAIVPAPEILPAPEPFRYRVRGEFHVVPPDGTRGHRLGFNRRRTYDTVAVDDCLIHIPNVTDALPGICRALDRAGAGSLRTLRLTSHPERRELLWKGLGGEPAPGFEAAIAAELDGWLVHQDSLSLEYDGSRIDGREAPPLMFRVDSDAFVQVNHEGAHALYGRALAYIGERPGALLEGFSGLGAISVLAATRPEPAARPTRLTLVEESRAANLLARLHLRLHGIDLPAEVLGGRVEARFGELTPDAADTIVVDPPRAGCEAPALAAMARLEPEALVYVSCDPATLGRDLHRLQDLGFAVEAQSLVDMFPQTFHIETVTRLVRKNGGSASLT